MHLLVVKYKYCFTTSEDNELLNLCKKNQMHTIIPSLIVKKNLYKTIKNNIESSPIIAIYPSMNIENELVTTINYLKQKGYKFYDLKTLLNEER